MVVIVAVDSYEAWSNVLYKWKFHMVVNEPFHKYLMFEPPVIPSIATVTKFNLDTVLILIKRKQIK